MNSIDRLEIFKQPEYIIVRPAMEYVNIHRGNRSPLHNSGETAAQNEFDIRF